MTGGGLALASDAELPPSSIIELWVTLPVFSEMQLYAVHRDLRGDLSSLRSTEKDKKLFRLFNSQWKTDKHPGLFEIRRLLTDGERDGGTRSSPFNSEHPAGSSIVD